MPRVQRRAYSKAVADKERQSLSDQIEAKRKALEWCLEAKMDELKRHHAASIALEHKMTDVRQRIREWE